MSEFIPDAASLLALAFPLGICVLVMLLPHSPRKDAPVTSINIQELRDELIRQGVKDDPTIRSVNLEELRKEILREG